MLRRGNQNLLTLNEYPTPRGIRQRLVSIARQSSNALPQAGVRRHHFARQLDQLVESAERRPIRRRAARIGRLRAAAARNGAATTPVANPQYRRTLARQLAQTRSGRSSGSPPASATPRLRRSAHRRRVNSAPGAASDPSRQAAGE